MNQGGNVFDSAFGMVCLYNTKIMLDVLIDGSWIIEDLEAKVL